MADKQEVEAHRILIAVDVADLATVQTLMAELQQGNQYGLEIAGIARDGTLVHNLAVEHEADVVLLSPEIPNFQADVIRELFHYPDRPILTIALVPEAGDWAISMEKAGAVGHLTTPVTTSKLGDLAKLVSVKTREAFKFRASDSYIPQLSPDVARVVDRGGWQRTSIAVWSMAGGVGKTTLAVNMAVALGDTAGKRTLLVDADMNKGDAHLLLLDAERIRAYEAQNIYALAKHNQVTGQLTWADVERFLTPYTRRGQKTGLSLLMGLPQTWMAAEPCLEGEAGEAFTFKLLEVARPHFDFIVFDLGQTYNDPVHLAVLGRVDLIFVVVNSTVTSLNACHKGLAGLRDAGVLDPDRIRVVVNKYHPSHGIGRREVQKALDGLPTFAEIGMDTNHTVTIAMNDADPVVTGNPKSEVARDIVELAATLYPPLTDIRRLQAGKSGGLLDRILRG